MKTGFVVLMILCGLWTYAYAQNYDPFNVPRGVSVYQPPPVTGGTGWASYPGGFNYIWSPGYGNPDVIIGIGRNPGLSLPPLYDPYDD